MLLELLLFFGIPYKDTNETAHRLIRRFGSLPEVLEADIEELKEIPEIGDHAATMLKLIHAITNRALAEATLVKGACTVVLSHNHPTGIAFPSFEAISTTKAAAELLNSIDVPLLEHLIVANDSYIPLLSHLEGQLAFCPDRTLSSIKVDLREFYKQL